MSSNEAKERILQVKNAILSLDNLKTQLNQSASNSKAQISTSVGQTMESLRGREVTLLSQVDELLKAMEKSIHHQQVRLCQALGTLQAGLSMVLRGGEATDRLLDDIIDKLKSLELTLEETPIISFRSGDADLLQSILNYGSVEGNDEPLRKALDNQGHGAASLQHSECYDAVNSASSAHFALPQLSSRVEDWLQKKAPSTKSTDNNVPTVLPSAASSHQLTGPRGTHTIASSPTSNDLSRWLMKQSVDLKEQQVSDLSTLQTAAAERKPGRCDQSQADGLQSVSLDLKGWLFQCPSSFSSTFSAVPNDSKMWLQQACQQLTSLNDLKHKNHFQHVSRDQSSWLCSQTYRRQVAGQKERDETTFFSHINKNKDFWLQKQTKSQTFGRKEHKVGSTVDKPCSTNTSCCRKTSAMDVDEKWLSSSTASTPAFLVKNICRANELCANLSECVSKPDCCTLWFQENSSVKNAIDPAQAFQPLSLELHEWLSPISQAQPKPSVNTPNREHTDSLFQRNNKNVSSSTWLMNPAFNAGDATQSVTNGEHTDSLFQRNNKNVSSSAWLMNPAINTGDETQFVPKFKLDKEESNLWFQKIASDNLPEGSTSMETEESGSTSSGDSTSSWLLVADDNCDKKREMHDQDKESEGWSICSDSHSVCTDQCTKDIAVADEYISKWLL